MTTPAERFAMCMAEAGFPLPGWYECDNGYCAWPWSGSQENTPEFWRASYGAARLVDMDTLIDLDRPCVDCYVAHKLIFGHPVGLRGRDICTHVEVSA